MKILVTAALYLELWKRHSSALTHRWGLATFDLAAEPPRPGYLASVSSKYSKFVKEKVNVITKLTEPYVPFWKIRVPNMVLSFSVVLFLVSTWKLNPTAEEESYLIFYYYFVFRLVPRSEPFLPSFSTGCRLFQHFL